MSFIIRRIGENEKKIFNNGVGHPIQSWEWGEFRKKTGNKVIRLGLFEGRKLIEGYQLTIHRIPYTNLKLGVFLKGPAPNSHMLHVLKEFARQEKLIFIRMEPNVTKIQNPNNKIQKILKRAGARPGRSFFTKSTFWIDLTKSEEEILAAMHPKTRYNIRVAQKHGVEVGEDNLPEAFEAYLNLMHETTKRQNFYAHTERYHRLMWKELHPAGIARMLTARHGKEIIAAWVLFVWKDTLYYPYGASTDRHKNIMASYAMMREAIKLGKRLGLKKFDLWGREEGKGFTRFKEGFSPQVIQFLGTWDLVINPVPYTLYRIAEEIRWKILKLPIPLPKPRFR
ncbi:MAG: peptidoglycan bridge formation glycyltransferase FemA/FemB family protein [Candidatus Blackburnbacteria bacterium]|nr:peptidoglycan bridge formation glycyltransferase FemA/FemB family protein [Candidatus Blackburnbacteria bacterium]